VTRCRSKQRPELHKHQLFTINPLITAGLGKSYAVEQALDRDREVSVCWATLPSRPTMRLVAATLFEQLTRLPAGRRSRFALTDELVEALGGGRPRAVVVDFTDRR